jgi:hypothetical protein
MAFFVNLEQESTWHAKIHAQTAFDLSCNIYKQVCADPRCQVTLVTKFYRWHLTPVGPQNPTCLMPPFWHLLAPRYLGNLWTSVYK